MIKLILLPIISALSIGCTIETVDISVRNNTKEPLDSVVIILNNYHLKLAKTNSLSTITRSIANDSLPNNGHDVMIHVLVKNKSNTQFKGGFYYNDLSGTFDKKYKITIERDSIRIE